VTSEGTDPARERSPDAEERASAADRRMADLLAKSGSPRDLRRKLESERSLDTDDLIGRLNALEFVGSLVGEDAEMPEQLGDYRITGVLGRGGMGTVYLAYQQQLDREVALKVLSRSWLADPTMRQRFRAEAKANASLHHRHIVPIYDYGEAQGAMFFAMERVDGRSLDRWIASSRRSGQRPMEPLDAAQRFSGVADALGLAHRRRLLHRDVKPGNILVAVDGTLSLTDFGLAKALDQVSAQLTRKSGGFLGTLHYSPPEQAVGRELTPASDLYSLGVTIFEAVTGELPISGRTTEALLQSILHGTPRRLRDVMPRAPRDLCVVLDKLLSREPGDRYQDGEVLARDLQRIADGEPVHIHRLPITVRLLRRARKNPLLAAAFLAAFVLLVVALALYQAFESEKQQGFESRYKNDLSQAASQVREERGSPWGPTPLLRSLTGLPVESAEDGHAVRVLEQLQRVEQAVPGDAAVLRMREAYLSDPEPSASALLASGSGYRARQLYSAAIDAALNQRSFEDHSIEIRLYGLYLGRAVANLTATVADSVAARRDLDLAAFLRPAAVFPMALAAALGVLESSEPLVELAALERRLVESSPERRLVTARLLWAAAGLVHVDGAHMMDFGLDYRVRRAIHDLASRWGGGGPASTAPVAIELPSPQQQLRSLVSRASSGLGDASTLRELRRRIVELVGAEVDARSPLVGWYGAMQLLERPRSEAPLLGVDGVQLSPRLRLASWQRLLVVEPPAEVLALLVDRFDAFRQAHPGLDGVLPLAAKLYLRVGLPQSAQMVEAWLVEAPRDPSALDARMKVALRIGQHALALDAATAMVQCSVDRAVAIARVISVWQAALSSAPEEARADYESSIAAFRQLQ
jgi:serine/threonine protein kinase